MKYLVILMIAFASILSFGRTISLDTYVCNPGQVVSVALTIDDLADVGASLFTITYDPTIVACLGIDAGDIINKSEMTYADTGTGIIVMLVPEFVGDTGGDIANIRFLARNGTAGEFSDVTIAEASVSAKDAVTDLTVANPIQIKNGMIRVSSSSASVTRLEEPFKVWSKTKLKELTLLNGDGIQASADGEAIIVSSLISSEGKISVEAPNYGWQLERYALISVPSSSKELVFEEIPSATITSETANGVTTYYANIEREDDFELIVDGGDLDATSLAAIRSYLTEKLASSPNVKKVKITGDIETIPVTVDLGISPKLDINGEAATVTYSKPSLRIIAFDCNTGLVRIKVTPGEDNTISSQLVTGCIHVYGTDDLSKPMRYISSVAIDVNDYLKTPTIGEADITVTMGSHTFFKVKAETEIKEDGDLE